MKEKKMGNIWQTLIKRSLHIFPFHPLKCDSSIGGGWVIPTTFLKLPKNWVIYMHWRQYLLIEKNILIFFLDSNLSFTIRIFTWGLENDLHVFKEYDKLQNKSF